jgi:hypothetical protein
MRYRNSESQCGGSNPFAFDEIRVNVGLAQSVSAGNETGNLSEGALLRQSIQAEEDILRT